MKKVSRKYRGLRKPRSNDPALWAIYNEVRGKGQREKRLTQRAKLANLIDAGLMGAPNEVK